MAAEVMADGFVNMSAVSWQRELLHALREEILVTKLHADLAISTGPQEAVSNDVGSGNSCDSQSTAVFDTPPRELRRPVYCHRLVMAAASPFLSGLMEDLEDPILLLPGFTSAEVETFLGSLYLGELEREEGRDVIGLADTLRISPRHLVLPQKSLMNKSETVKAGADEALVVDVCQELDTTSKGPLAAPGPITLNHSQSNKPYKCEICPAQFRWRTEYRAHSADKHGIKVVEVKQCHECCKEIVSSRFAEHVRTVHRKERPHPCDECNKAFTKAKDLKNHKRSHTGDRPFVCKQCGARFAISHQLTRHIQYHEGVNKYKCSECDKAFLQKNDLKKHMRTHTGERPFKCDECDSSFARNDYLKKHKHLHQNPDGHPCIICKITFPAKEDLKKHMASSHRENKKPRILAKSKTESELMFEKYDESGLVGNKTLMYANKSFMYFIHDDTPPANKSLSVAGNGVGRLVLPHPTPLIPQPQSPLLSAAGAPAADHEQLLRAPADHAKLIRVPAVGHEHLLRGPVVEHEELLPVEGDTVILHHQEHQPHVIRHESADDQAQPHVIHHESADDQPHVIHHESANDQPHVIHHEPADDQPHVIHHGPLGGEPLHAEEIVLQDDGLVMQSGESEEILYTIQYS